jgi:hypothetical protein
MGLRDLRWDEEHITAESVLDGVARATRAAGLAKLSVFVLTPSRLEQAMRRCGFVQREDDLAFFALSLSGEELPPAEDWLPTFIDGTVW